MSRRAVDQVKKYIVNIGEKVIHETMVKHHGSDYFLPQIYQLLVYA